MHKMQNSEDFQKPRGTQDIDWSNFRHDILHHSRYYASFFEIIMLQFFRVKSYTQTIETNNDAQNAKY